MCEPATGSTAVSSNRSPTRSSMSDDAEPVLEGAGRVAIGDPAGDLVEREEAEPDRELAPEVGPSPGQCRRPAATIVVIRKSPNAGMTNTNAPGGRGHSTPRCRARPARARPLAVRRQQAMRAQRAKEGATRGTMGSPAALPADVAHLDLGQVGRCWRSGSPSSGRRASPRSGRSPRASSSSEASPRTTARRSWPRTREQAGVQPSLGREACARAIAAERLRDGGDHADLAAAVPVAPAPCDLAAVVRLDGLERQLGVDRGDDLGRRNDLVEPPAVRVADVHVLDEAEDVPPLAERAAPSAGCSCSLTPRLTTMFTFTGRPAAAAASMPSSTRSTGKSTSFIAREDLVVERVQADGDPPQPRILQHRRLLRAAATRSSSASGRAPESRPAARSAARGRGARAARRR